MKVPPKFHQGCTRFCKMVRRGPDTGLYRVPQGSHKGSTRLHKVSQGFHKCSGKQCVVRPPSEKPSESKLRAQQIALLMGGTLSKAEINGFHHTFTVLTCSLEQTTRPEMLDRVVAGLTVQQGKCLGITECYLVGFGFRGFHESCEGYGVRFQNAPPGFHQVLQKKRGSARGVPRGGFARFTGPRSGPDCTVGARLRRSPGCAVNCAKLASPSFARYGCKAAS